MADVIEVVQPGSTVLEIRETVTAVLEVIERGPQGPAGPAGIDVPPHQQDTPSSTWIIPHSIGRFPAVACFDLAGERIYPDEHASTTSVTLVFATPMAGTAVLT